MSNARCAVPVQLSTISIKTMDSDSVLSEVSYVVLELLMLAYDSEHCSRAVDIREVT